MIYWLHRLGVLCTRFLPGCVVYPLADLLGSLAYLLLANKRRILRSNLSRVFHGGPCKEVVIWRIFRNYARYFATLFRFPILGQDELDRLIKIRGLENLEVAFNKGKGVVIITAHVGHWDLGGAIVARRFKVNVFPEALRPKGLFDLYTGLRESQGMRVIKGPNPLKRLILALRRGEIVVVLCDRNIRGKGIRLPFFGEETPISTIPASIAIRTGARIVPGFVIRQKRGEDYTAIIKEEIEVRDLYSTTLKITKVIEDHISSFYDNWYMFQPIWGK